MRERNTETELLHAGIEANARTYELAGKLAQHFEPYHTALRHAPDAARVEDLLGSMCEVRTPRYWPPRFPNEPPEAA